MVSPQRPLPLTSESWTGGSVEQERTCTYDKAGNRLSKTIDPDVGSTLTTNYTYDDLNQLLSFTGDEAATYTHDLNGNRVTKTVGSDTTTYVYDVSDRLIEAKDDNDDTIFTATYDARTRRLAKTEGTGTAAVTKLFRYDGGTNYQELSAGSNASSATDNVLQHELIRAGGLGGGIGSVLYDDDLTSTDPASVEFFVYNAIGSTVALSDYSSAVTQSTLYEAFGETVSQTGTSTNNRLRNTKERDSSIGLDNDGFRYYDPATGRYIQRDPIGYGDGMNVYQSVRNNPITSVDPLGLQTADEEEKRREARKPSFLERFGNWFNAMTSSEPMMIGGPAGDQLREDLETTKKVGEAVQSAKTPDQMLKEKLEEQVKRSINDQGGTSPEGFTTDPVSPDKIISTTSDPQKLVEQEKLKQATEDAAKAAAEAAAGQLAGKSDPCQQSQAPPQLRKSRTRERCTVVRPEHS